jgi:hypothetical protein
MESARRWNGFVCPDCRFVFRVPRDHDGQGVVCPSCRRLLKIPLPGDRPPPLVVPLRAPMVEKEQPQQPDEAPRSGGNRRRRKRSRKSDDHSWDNSAASTRRSGKGEKRQMFWMLAGGGTLFALVLGFVLMAMLGGGKTDPTAATPAIVPSMLPPAAPETMGDAAFISAAEPMARKFLEAKSIEEMLPLVRKPDTAAPRMRGFYQDGKIKPAGMAEFNTGSFVTRLGSAMCVQIRTLDFEDRFLAFFETADGLRIDWESWSGWSEMPWDAFMAGKPVTAHVFRVKISTVEYYNNAFTDDAKWQSFFLESPNGGHAIYGYAEQGTSLAASLKPSSDVRWAPLTLSLRYLPDATSPNQVIIEKIISDSWVEQTNDKP